MRIGTWLWWSPLRSVASASLTSRSALGMTGSPSQTRGRPQASVPSIKASPGMNRCQPSWVRQQRTGSSHSGVPGWGANCSPTTMMAKGSQRPSYLPHSWVSWSPQRGHSAGVSSRGFMSSLLRIVQSIGPEGHCTTGRNPCRVVVRPAPSRGAVHPERCAGVYRRPRSYRWRRPVRVPSRPCERTPPGSPRGFCSSTRLGP
uniref:Uncharacterized protein n=1 Tax=uncultured marine virus TaxID=186617 RepID=A0A0F7L3A8_9VIRU|nr:hypothetical protein [uncultured marine virus]